jgi:hypothetical protein
MTRIQSTRTELANGRSPTMLVNWSEDEDGNGWTGKVTFWKDGNTQEPSDHAISLRQTIPLGAISVVVDECCGAGCWAMTRLDGVGITERDLQWAAAYALEALLRKRSVIGVSA